VASVDEFLNAAATETVPLFEHPEFEFLLGYDVFAPSKRRRTRVHEPPDLFRGFLHCYYEDVYGTRPVARELRHGLVWYYCGLDNPPSRDTIDRFLTDLEHVSNDVFTRLVKQAATRGLLDSTYSIDSTHIEAIQYNDAASWNYDPTLRLRLYDRLDRPKDPDCSGVHPNQASESGDGDAHGGTAGYRGGPSRGQASFRCPRIRRLILTALTVSR